MSPVEWLFKNRPKAVGRFAAWLLWDIGEAYRFSWGPLAPYLFGLQIGVFGKRVR